MSNNNIMEKDTTEYEYSIFRIFSDISVYTEQQSFKYEVMKTFNNFNEIIEYAIKTYGRTKQSRIGEEELCWAEQDHDEYISKKEISLYQDFSIKDRQMMYRLGEVVQYFDKDYCKRFESFLIKKVIGQKASIEKIADWLEKHMVEVN